MIFSENKGFPHTGNHLKTYRNPLPVGKLPVDLLAELLSKTPIQDKRVLLGPGIGLDCAVVELGNTLLTFKTDPITFATDAIGWYAVQVNANDIATSGATPRWFLVTLLLPERETTPELAEQIVAQLADACRQLDIDIIGGHTEITYDLKRPLLIGTLIGEVSRERLITPRGAQPGDRLLLTKGVPIEATAILAREFSERLSQGAEEQGDSAAVRERHHGLTKTELEEAKNFLFEPGISVVRDARIATQAGQVHAMHDPTEGGLAGALWELAEACGHSLFIDLSAVPVPTLSRRICSMLGTDPLSAIASGALLLAAPEGDVYSICQALEAEGIPCAEIGVVLDEPGTPLVWQSASPQPRLLPRPQRDAIALLFE